MERVKLTTIICEPIVSAHPYTHAFTRHVMHRARIIGQMTIVIALPGFNDSERSITPIFLFDGSFSLPALYVQRKK